ncbi:Peptidyl-prolyl cis-trans isomerase-like 4 [Cryptotrichosporon argae]
MSVMLETSLGDLIIDLEVDKCPRTCENFLKLCKVKYYALNAFFNVSKDFIAQTGDPTATGTGGCSFAAHLPTLVPTAPVAPRYFMPEIRPSLKHVAKGTVSMAVAPTDPPGCGSQFFVTLADRIEYLDGKHAVFGHVIEGLDVLDKINEAYLDQDGRPLQDIRIRHVEVLDDPFPDPVDLLPVPDSPLRPPDASTRIADDEDVAAPPEDVAEAKRRQTAASSSALTLEMIGDLPFAAVRPPENILFVCKLNPVTADEDLELIFSRFGKILSCEIVRDKKTGDSLQYAFIEFDEKEAAEQAYFKMQNVLVDDRRIWVDFSQSVAKMNRSFLSNPTRGGRGGRGGGRVGGPGRGGFARDNGYGGSGGARDNGYGTRAGAGAVTGTYDFVFEDRSRSPARVREGKDDSERERERRDGRDDYGRDRRRSRSRDRRDREDCGQRDDRREKDGRRDDRRDGDRERRDRDKEHRDRDRDRRDRDRDRDRDDGRY